MEFMGHPSSGVSDIRSSLQGHLSLIQEMCDEVVLNCLSNAGYAFRFALLGLNNLAERRLLLSGVERQHSEVQESAACILSLERQVAVHFADSASACGDMTRLEKPTTVGQRPLVYTQSAQSQWRVGCRLGVEEQRCGSLKALLCCLCRRLVDHAFLVDWIWGFLCQNGRDIDVFFRQSLLR